jgi:hypothetical protein
MHARQSLRQRRFYKSRLGRVCTTLRLDCVPEVNIDDLHAVIAPGDVNELVASLALIRQGGDARRVRGLYAVRAMDQPTNSRPVDGLPV